MLIESKVEIGGFLGESRGIPGMNALASILSIGLAQSCPGHPQACPRVERVEHSDGEIFKSIRTADVDGTMVVPIRAAQEASHPGCSQGVGTTEV